MKKVILIGAIVAVCLVTLNLVNGPSNTSAQGYTIGVLLPITGDASVYGESARNATLLQKANLASADDTLFTIQIEDTGLKPAQTVSALEKIKSDAKLSGKKLGAILSFSSGETLAICSKTESEHILLLSSGSSPKISECGDMTFSNFPSDIYQAKVLAERLSGKAGLGIIYMKNEYGTGLYSEFVKYNTSASVTVGFLPDTKDFRTTITELKKQGVTELLLIGQPKESAVFLKQADELAFNPKNIYTPEALKDQSFADVVPARYTSIIHSLAPIFYSGKEADLFKQKYVSTYNAGPALFADYVYDNISLAQEVLKACSSDNKPCITNKLKNIEMIGSAGALHFGDQHSAQDKQYEFYTIRNGKFEVE